MGASSQKTCWAPPNPEPLAEGRLRCFVPLLAGLARSSGVAALAAPPAGRVPSRRAQPQGDSDAAAADRVALAHAPPRCCSRSAPGTQVVAVDDQSDYPAGAPLTTLSGFAPNVEAIAAYKPDLVVIACDPAAGAIAAAGSGIRVLDRPAARRTSRTRTRRSRARRRHRPRCEGDERRRGDEAEDRVDRRARPQSTRRCPSTTSSSLTCTRRRRRRSSGASTALRPPQHRGRRRLDRKRLPAALGRVHHLGEPVPDRPRGLRLLRADAADRRRRGPAGTRSPRCGTARDRAHRRLDRVALGAARRELRPRDRRTARLPERARGR